MKQQAEKTILGSAIVIVGIGLLVRLKGGDISHGTLDQRVIFGGFAFFMLLGLLSAINDSAAKVASGLAMVTAAGAVFYQAPELFGIFSDLQRGTGGGQSGFHGPDTGIPRGDLPHN